MNLRINLMIAFLLFGFMSACSLVTNTGGLLSYGEDLPEPEPGKASIIGKVTSIDDGKPIGDVTVRLAEVYRQGDQGAYVLDGAQSPGDITDELGKFFIQDVEAKEYVIVVGDVYGSYDIISESSGEAKVFNAISDEILDVGELEVDIITN